VISEQQLENSKQALKGSETLSRTYVVHKHCRQVTLYEATEARIRNLKLHSSPTKHQERAHDFVHALLVGDLVGFAVERK